MKNMVFLSAALLAFAAPAFGQAPDQPSSATQNTGATQNETEHSSRKTVTMTGCVIERNGKYFLMTNNHRNAMSNNESNQANESGQQGRQSKRGREIELAGNQDLQTYVGQTVTVTGHFQHNASAMGTGNDNASRTEPNDKGGNTANSTQPGTTTGGKRHHGQLQVTNVQPVSNSCNMNNAGGSGSQPR